MQQRETTRRAGEVPQGQLGVPFEPWLALSLRPVAPYTGPLVVGRFAESWCSRPPQGMRSPLWAAQCLRRPSCGGGRAGPCACYAPTLVVPERTRPAVPAARVATKACGHAAVSGGREESGLLVAQPLLSAGRRRGRATRNCTSFLTRGACCGRFRRRHSASSERFRGAAAALLCGETLAHDFGKKWRNVLCARKRKTATETAWEIRQDDLGSHCIIRERDRPSRSRAPEVMTASASPNIAPRD